MKRVVSVSLGSSKRDKRSKVEILGVEFEVSRVGTDGDMAKFAQLVKELDGNVDVIGLGGIDRYLWTDKRRYTIKDADKLARNALKTPVVDGSGVKNTLERRTVEYLQNNGIVDFSKSRVMVTSAVDRFGMAQTISKLCNDVIYGDLMFACNVPIPLRSYGAIRVAAHTFLPLVCILPFKWIYPTGQKQEKSIPKYQNYYKWADVVAGDWLFVRRTMPTVESGLLKDKILVTNTVTQEDVELLKSREARLLVTSSPAVDGRYFATNVFEGILITLLGKKPEETTVEDYTGLLEKMDWKPTITDLA